MPFSRQQPLDPRIIDPNQVIEGLGDMIRRTMGPTVEVSCVLMSVGNINCDFNQLENALLKFWRRKLRSISDPFQPQPSKFV